MIEKTYKSVVETLKDQPKPKYNVTLIVKNIETHSDDIIVNNCSKVYNRTFIVFDPQHSVRNNQFANESRNYYICHSLAELEEIGLFLLQNAESLMTIIDPEDMLEQL